MGRNATPVVVTGTGLTGLRKLTGFYFTETGGANSVTIVLRRDSAAGAIIWRCDISAGKSTGEDYDTPEGPFAEVHVTVSGLGTCQGNVRGMT